MNIQVIRDLVTKSDKDSALALVPAETLLKFSELLVQECFKVVEDFAIEQSREPETQTGLSLLIGMKITDAAWEIKEHFGIEE